MHGRCHSLQAVCAHPSSFSWAQYCLGQGPCRRGFGPLEDREDPALPVGLPFQMQCRYMHYGTLIQDTVLIAQRAASGSTSLSLTNVRMLSCTAQCRVCGSASCDTVHIAICSAPAPAGAFQWHGGSEFFFRRFLARRRKIDGETDLFNLEKLAANKLHNALSYGMCTLLSAWYYRTSKHAIH